MEGSQRWEANVGSLPSPKTSPERYEGKRVLIAEDEPDARSILAAVLRGMGLEVIEAGDGRTMLAAVMAHYKNGQTPEDLDLIITDVHLPVVDGLEVFRGLRAAHWTTPTIIMTGDATDDVRRVARNLDATVLSKPIDLDALERAVSDLLAPPAPASGTSPTARQEHTSGADR